MRRDGVLVRAGARHRVRCECGWRAGTRQPRGEGSGVPRCGRSGRGASAWLGPGRWGWLQSVPLALVRPGGLGKGLRAASAAAEVSSEGGGCAAPGAAGGKGRGVRGPGARAVPPP